MINIHVCARRYVEKIPGAISGSGGHNQTFTVACALIKGFDFSIEEAWPLLCEYNARCEPPWSDAELRHKLNSADRTADDQPRGWLRLNAADAGGDAPRKNTAPPVSAPEPKPAFRDDKLKAFAARWREFVDTAWLADRSPVHPYRLTSDGFLRALYREGEQVVIFTEQKSQGQALWPRAAILKGGAEGVWFLAQPVDGKTHPNPRTRDAQGQPKPSRRSEESVTNWRYMVIESDVADPRDWMAVLVQLPLRIAAIYTSGKRSIHALVRVDAPSKNEWDFCAREMKPILVTLGADPKSLSAVRLTRLPGCLRAGKMQKLLFLNPEPEAMAICSMPRLRDVLAHLTRWVHAVLAVPERATDAGFWCQPDTLFKIEEMRWFESSPIAQQLLEQLADFKAGKTPPAAALSSPVATPAARFVVKHKTTGLFLLEDRAKGRDDYVHDAEDATKFSAERARKVMAQFGLDESQFDLAPL